MGTEITKNYSLEQVTDDILATLETALYRALVDEEAEIQIRTRSGQGPDGEPFPDYSKGYAKFREKRGRNTSPVDLTFTGNMLNSSEVGGGLQTTVNRDGVQITGEMFFNDTTAPDPRSGKQVSARDKAGWNDATRPFFSLNETQVNRIVEKLDKAIEDI
jgi:hypothetical protein